MSERQRLWLTIGASVLLTGGITAAILLDRREIDDSQERIAELDARIATADVEIDKTKGREDELIVFRAVQSHELEILPRQQQIADFHANLTTFLTQAGASFTKLPENAPKESQLARGIYATPNVLEFQADAPALLRLINMIEIDPRLVAVKGLKIRSAGRAKPGDAAPAHKVTLNLETYYYNPPANDHPPIPIPNEADRLEDPAIKQRVTAFTPERRDSYTLRPSASRRDPFVDVRKELVVEDPEALRKRFEGEEAIVLDLERRHDGIREKVEEEKALASEHDIFRLDRLAREIDDQVNDLRARIGSVASVKSVTFPDLLARVERVRQDLDVIASSRKQLPRDFTVTPAVSLDTLKMIGEAFDAGNYAEVATLIVAWEQFIRGKPVDPAALPTLDRIKDYNRRAKVLSEFGAKGIHVTGSVTSATDATQSIALVNGKGLRVGEFTDSKKDVKVLEVRTRGVEFSYQGERIFVPTEDAAASRSGTKPAAPKHK